MLRGVWVLAKVLNVMKNKIKGVMLWPIGIVVYFCNMIVFLRQYHMQSKFEIMGLLPIVMDRFKQNGNYDSHYFLQDIYMAQKIIVSNTSIHYDIGSQVDGFIGHLISGFRGGHSCSCRYSTYECCS